MVKVVADQLFSVFLVPAATVLFGKPGFGQQPIWLRVYEGAIQVPEDGHRELICGHFPSLVPESIRVCGYKRRTIADWSDSDRCLRRLE